MNKTTQQTPSFSTHSRRDFLWRYGGGLGGIALASLLQQVVRRLQTQLNPLSYNLILHTAPFVEEEPFGEKEVRFYHWHLELIPRIAQLAGLEWGAGVYINSLSPEKAAKLLRMAKI